MTACPKCGKESKTENNSRKYFLENRRGKVSTIEFCKFCN